MARRSWLLWAVRGVVQAVVLAALGAAVAETARIRRERAR